VNNPEFASKIEARVFKIHRQKANFISRTHRSIKLMSMSIIKANTILQMYSLIKMQA